MTTDPTSPLAPTLEQYFKTKSSGDVEGTMAYFSPDMVAYIDATLGWNLSSFDVLRALFVEYMPTWPPEARSYSTGILSNETSALVHMVDTPELFGGELRILAAIDFVDGKIVRWLDYWDATAYDGALYDQLRTPAADFPTDFKENAVPTQAAPKLIEVATALQEALAGGRPQAIGGLLHTDVTLVDMALRTNVIGRLEVVSYLDRAVDALPYGRGSTLRHVVGGDNGGGFEWTAGPGHDGLVGITAIELDADGLITKLTSVYDSRQMKPNRKQELVAAATAL